MDATVFLDPLLRLLGAFYAFGSLAGLRRTAMDRLLTQAIGAIGNPDPKETAAENRRNRWLTANMVLVGVGGIALMALLDVAAWLFVIELALYALYLFVLAPRLFDPFDPPEEPGRSQTRNAFWIYLAVTVLVLAAWWGGRLTPLIEAHPAVLALAGALALGLIGYAVHQMRSARLDRPAGRWPFSGPPDDDQANGTDVSAEADEEWIARIRETPLVMRPSWGQGAFFDARTGEPVHLPLYDEFTIEDDGAVAGWLTLFYELADRDDPWRCALRDPDGLKRLEEEGRPIFERLLARMGPERIRFDPQPAPVSTKHETTLIKLMVDYPCHPIWLLDDNRCDPVDPNEFGISWQLASDIVSWEMEAAPSREPGDPDAPPPPTEAELDAHEERGRRLAVRLARELAATGRGHVTVYAYTRAMGVVPARPDDPL